MLKLLVISLFSVSSMAGMVVKDVRTYEQAALEACSGQSIGAACTITFQGGSVSIGICVKLPEGSPAAGQITCQIDPRNLPGCAQKAAARARAGQ